MRGHDHNLLSPGRIDSWLKLQILSIFERHTTLCRDVRGLSEWLCANPWALEQTLEELAALELLERIELDGRAHYRYGSGSAWHDSLSQILHRYSDPQQCEQIVALVRDAERERQYEELRVAIERGADDGPGHAPRRIYDPRFSSWRRSHQA